MRLDIRRIQAIKQGTEVVGNRTRVTVKKNKVAPPFRVAEFDIMYNEGISTEGDIARPGRRTRHHHKRGAFYRYGDTRFGQGRENAKTFLAENVDICTEIDRRIRDNFGLSANLSPTGDAAATTVPLADKAKAVRASVRPAVDDDSISYASDDEPESLDEAA